ncbi:FdrA protein [Pilibacter termitis]|uniref:FdrA protein n=1 Tax=Pilibacter termitis TaxID=263852 RepID=A0A1T4LBR3_9ENTE|nr:acyl-CoA synthetase FdrA [Pilibacter termitis]SJZ52120.1 FdrA protein [Pilibacter termitis]
MLQTIIKKNSYQDSVVLMLLTNKINELDAVKRVSIMMGTPANKDIFIAAGFDTPEMKEASANDMVIMLELENGGNEKEVLEKVDEYLLKQQDGEGVREENVNSWEKALKKAKNASVALFSIPGAYVPLEVEKALHHGLHAFIFSDNVPVEEELRLKKLAHEKGLLVMGPDCGTGILHTLPLAFTNNIRAGKIGIVGASGTGIQEVSTLIHRYGQGVSNAIGTGGRDLSSEVGAISMIDAIVALNEDVNVDTIVVISKPPAKEIKEKVMKLLHAISKPVVTIFIGEKPSFHEKNIYQAYTLEETAQLATKIQNHEPVQYTPRSPEKLNVKLTNEQVGIRGFYAGGTLAYEASMLLKDALVLEEVEHKEGVMLQTSEHSIIDLGDDIYTNGKPHPMIDPENRIGKIKEIVNDSTVATVLFDIVLGYGAHKNMAECLAKVIKEVQETLALQKREVAFIGVIVGTDLDVQGMETQKKILEEVGVTVCENNTQAVQTALKLLGKEVQFVEKEIYASKEISCESPLPKTSKELSELLSTKPTVINVGLKSFTESIIENNGEVVQYNWAPVAGGNIELQKILHFLDTYQFKKS